MADDGRILQYRGHYVNENIVSYVYLLGKHVVMVFPRALKCPSVLLEMGGWTVYCQIFAVPLIIVYVMYLVKCSLNHVVTCLALTELFQEI